MVHQESTPQKVDLTEYMMKAPRRAKADISLPAAAADISLPAAAADISLSAAASWTELQHNSSTYHVSRVDI